MDVASSTHDGSGNKIGSEEASPGERGLWVILKGAATPSFFAFSDAADVNRKALVDGDRHLHVHVADGKDETLGAKSDTAATTDTGTFSLISLFKRLLQGITKLFGNRTANSFTAVASGTGDTQGLSAVANLRLMGFSVCETAAIAGFAELILRHGTAITDPIIAQIKLAPGESGRDWFGDQGIAVASGVFIDRVSGTTQVSLYHRIEA